MHGPAKM